MLTSSDATGVQRRQRTMLVAGLMLLPFLLLDLGLPNGPWVAVAGGAWSAAILAGAWLQRSSRRWVRVAGLLGASVGGVGAALAKALLTGGPASVFFPLFLALPLLVLAVAPDLPLLVASTGLAALLAGIAVRGAAAQPLADVLYWVALATSVLALAVVGSRQVAQQVAHELEVERERVEALAALAESERRRGEAERYAEVGRLAATISHEMNNPLASVAANLRWLGSGDASDLAEQRAVQRETLEAVDRLAEVLRQIRQVAHAVEADGSTLARSGAPPAPSGPRA